MKKRKKSNKKITRKSAPKKQPTKKEMPTMKKAKSKKRNRVAAAITRATRSAPARIKRAARRVSGTKQDMKTIATNAGLGVIGAIIASFVANKLPIKDARIKSALPLIAGIGAAMTKIGSSKMAQPIIAGAIIGGGVSMVRQFVPGLATLAGEDDDIYPDSIMGGLEDFSGVQEIGYNNISDSEIDSPFGDDSEIEDYSGDETEIWATQMDV